LYGQHSFRKGCDARHERVEAVAVARGLDGTISVSQIASFVPHA
jgi:hypothetical protein